jgi:hypothetical protein
MGWGEPGRRGCVSGDEPPTCNPALPRLVKLDVRSTLAMILAALALAGAERIGRGGGDGEAAHTHATSIRHGGGARAEKAEQAPLLAYLRGGSLLLDVPARRMGGVPPSRVARDGTLSSRSNGVPPPVLA